MQHPMIEVDGVMKHRNNSLGQPIHPTDEGIKNFHRWFGDSKIVDKHGRPIPYYRGSKNKNAEAYNNSSMIFLSPSPEFVKNYARDGQTFKLYVKSDKPFDASRGNGYANWKKFQQETNAPSYATSSSDRGALPHWQQEYDLRNWLNNNVDYDSIYFAESDRSHSIAVKNTNQIKSAIGNKGTFSHQTEINESVDHPMIEVDGEMRHRNNSLGQPIHPTDEGIKNFHRWFSGSQTIDEHGRPKVFYHGSPSSEIHAFDRSFEGANTGSQTDEHGLGGFYFTSNPNIADTYSRSFEVEMADMAQQEFGIEPKQNLPKSTIYPVYLKMKRPMLTDKAISKSTINSAILSDKDGIVLDNGDYNESMVFDPSQIKSAIGNTGSYRHPTKILESVQHPMIEVDGVMRHRHNSLGQPIHPTDEGIKNFHRWFVGSNAVDEHGRPLVLYHGTAADFNSFDPERHGENTGNLVPHSTFVFSDSPSVASTYAVRRIDYANNPEYKTGGNVMPVYINTKKILKINAKGHNWNDIIRKNEIVDTNDIFNYAKSKGYNSVIIKNVSDVHKGDKKISNVYAVFDEKNIKSSTGNIGEFSIFSKNITESTDHPMIEVDGVMKHQHNSLGQPIHPTDEGIKNFHRWFGNDSSYVDEHGRPKIAYHGTTKSFAQFKRSSYGFTGPGIYFGDSSDVANSYAGDDVGANVIPVYIRGNVISHKKYSDDYIMKYGWKESEQKAKDDKITGVYDTKYENAINVFDSSDVKSAIGNSGAFAHPTKITESTEHPMISIDGVLRHRNNSEGQPIHPLDEGIRNFHRWFGNSENVDEHGRPKVYYHGSNYSDPTTGESFSAHRNTLWVSETPDLANQYAEARQDRGANSSVMPVYVRSRKLFDADKLHHTLRTGDFFKAIGAQAPGIDYKDLGDLADKAREGARQEESGPHYSRHDFWHEPHFLFGSEGADAIHSAFRLGGFSGIRSTETVSNFVNGNFVDVPHKTIGVFDPRDVKSVIGNSGNYSSSIHMHEELIAESADGNYVAVKAILPKEVKQIIRSIDLTVEPIKDADLHATLMYSTKTDIPEEKINKALNLGKKEFSGIIKHINKFDSQKNSDKCCIVIEIESNDLRRLHDRLVRIGAEHSFDEFRPHVSIAYDVPVKEANKIMKTLNNKLDGYQIKFSGFIVEPIKD